MTEALKIVTFIDLLFVLLLMASGTVTGVFGTVIYYLAFFIPVVIAFCYSRRLKREREEQRGLAEAEKTYLSLDKRAVSLVAPIMPLAIGITILMALLTSIILGLFGFSGDPLPDAPIWQLLIVHALVPAILEEMLFRYVPMKLLLPYSSRICILVSAVYFALTHCNLFQIPYALMAGVALMLIDVMADSIWPSVIMHLANNTLSIIWSKYCNDRVSVMIFAYSMVLLQLISVIYIWRNKEKYKAPLDAALSDAEHPKPTYAPVALVVVTLYVAFMNLFN